MNRWPTKPLGELVLPTEQRDPKEIPTKEFYYVDIASVDNETKAIVETKRIRGADAPSRARKVIRRGDVIVSTVRPNLNAVALVPDNLDNQICSTGFSVLRPSSNVTSGYLFAVVRSPFFIDCLVARTRGANYPAVNDGEVKDVPIPVPHLAEQERIVKLLDEADELRKLRAQADRRTADIIPALFYDMFGRADFVEKTIGQFLDQGWLLLHKDGNHGSLYPRSSDFGVEGIPFLSAACVTDEGTIDHSEVKRLAEEKAKLLRHGWIKCGDVLLAHNASVGAVGFYDGEYDRAIIGTSLTAFRANLDRVEPRFLWASLRDAFFQGQLERIMKQAVRNQVPITAQRDLLLRIPPLPLQKEFAARVSNIRAMQAEQAASRRRLDDLFQSMLHRAFQGEL